MIDYCELKGENESVITWQVQLQKETKTNFSCVVGSAFHEAVEPGICTMGLPAGRLQMPVKTYDVNGRPAKRPIHLAAFRAQARQRALAAGRASLSVCQTSGRGVSQGRGPLPAGERHD